MYTDKAARDNGLCVYAAKCGPCFFKSNRLVEEDHKA